MCNGRGGGLNFKERRKNILVFMKIRIQRYWMVSFILIFPLAFPVIGLQEELDSDYSIIKIRVLAEKYKFIPNLIKVKKGHPVRLEITAVDRDHGIQIKDFDIKQRLVKEVETVIEFIPKKAGIFIFKCSVRCGWRHGKMKGKLIVED